MNYYKKLYEVIMNCFLNTKMNYAIIGTVMFSICTWISLANTGNEYEYMRYIFPVLVGLIAGIVIDGIMQRNLTHIRQAQGIDHAEQDSGQDLRQCNDELEDKIDCKAQQYANANQELVGVKHTVVRTETLSNILQNVGDVLASITLTTGLLKKKNADSKCQGLAKAVNMIKQHEDGLSEYLLHTEKGTQLLEYLYAVTDCFVQEQKDIEQILIDLSGNVRHVVEVLSVQQDNGKLAGLTEFVVLSEVVQDAVHVILNDAKQYDIKVVCEFEDVPQMAMDRHKIIQIVMSLLSNAKHSLKESEVKDRILSVSTRIMDKNHVSVCVQDNGVGIPNEDMAKLFDYGFSTRPDGHGFGLHTARNAADILGGIITASSDGVGKGALFVFELPCADIVS